MGRILVVDDDPNILKMASRILGSADHTVVTAPDAIQAMELLHSYHFDLLLADANLPQYSGFDLIRTLRNHKRFTHLSIAMLTGLSERKDIEKAIKVGIDDYIVKPVDPLLFKKKIDNLFSENPPLEMPELQFPPNSDLRRASLHIDAEIVSLTEMGMTLISSQKPAVGSIIVVGGALFTSIEILPPRARVVSVESIQPGGTQWKVKVIFFGANEAMLQKIRAWIFSKNAFRKRVMA